MRFKLNDVKIQNFMSYGNKVTEFDFTKPETVLIVGNNEDIGEIGESKNGVGKTVSMIAVVYALYGEGINKLKADEMINLVNEKKMLVELNFESHGVDYKIIRGRKPNVLEFYKGSESLTADSMKNTDLAIQEVLGINYDTFLISFLMNTSTTPFMARKPTEQKQFMEDNLGLTLLTKRAETLKMFRNEYETESKVTARQLEMASDQNDQTRRQIEKSYEYAEDFETRRGQKISQLQQYIDANRARDLSGIRDRIVVLENSVSEVREQLTVNRNERRELEREATDISKQINSVKNSRVSAEKDKEHFKSRINDITNKIDKQAIDLDADTKRLDTLKPIKAKYDDFDDLIRVKVPNAKKELDKLTTKTSQIEKKYDSNEDALDHLLDEKCPFCKQQYSDQEAAARIVSLRSEQVDMEEEFTQLRTAVDSLEVELDEYNKIVSSTSTEVKEFDVSEMNQLQANLPMLERQIKSSKLELDETQKNLDGLVIDDSMDVDQMEFHLDELSDAHELIENTISDMEDKQIQYDKDLKELPFASVREVEDVIMEIAQKEEDLTVEKFATNTHVNQAEELKKSIIDVVSLKQTADEFDDKVKHVNYLIKLLTNSKSFIRKDIINQYIGFLNKKVNEYTTELGLPHYIEFKSDLTVDVEYMRKQVSYYNLSAGERLRLDIAVSLAFRAMLAMVGSTSNILFVDELLDSAMDSSGVRNAFKLFQGYADHVSLISHRADLDTLVDRVMVITKKNGFSLIK